MIDRRKYIKDTYLRGINKYKHYFFEDKKKAQKAGKRSEATH